MTRTYICDRCDKTTQVGWTTVEFNELRPRRYDLCHGCTDTLREEILDVLGVDE